MLPPEAIYFFVSVSAAAVAHILGTFMVRLIDRLWTSDFVATAVKVPLNVTVVYDGRKKSACRGFVLPTETAEAKRFLTDAVGATESVATSPEEPGQGADAADDQEGGTDD